jgi:tetratricopeptide (TPR) repeat protein
VTVTGADPFGDRRKRGFIAIVAIGLVVGAAAIILLGRDNPRQEGGPAAPPVSGGAPAQATAPAAGGTPPQATASGAPAPGAVPATPAGVPPAASPVEKARAACRDASEKELPDVVLTCQQALQLKPDMPDVMAMMASATLEAGHPDEALVWAKRANEIDPNLPEPYVLIGTIEHQAKHHDVAKAAYQRYLELAPRGRYADDLRSILQEMK